ncbi:MAG: YopX family protein [Ruminococcus sp.]|nr:YopX family protein [Ruminococcus sp.]
MHTLLFRGKRLDNGKWLTGSETYVRDSSGIWLSDKRQKAVGIIPETLGLYTGHADRNGKAIYDGDILQTYKYAHNVWLHTVKWSDECGMFILPCINDDPVMDTDFTVFSGSDFEIRGNVYDDPELLNICGSQKVKGADAI